MLSLSLDSILLRKTVSRTLTHTSVQLKSYSVIYFGAKQWRSFGTHLHAVTDFAGMRRIPDSRIIGCGRVGPERALSLTIVRMVCKINRLSTTCGLWHNPRTLSSVSAVLNDFDLK